MKRFLLSLLVLFIGFIGITGKIGAQSAGLSLPAQYPDVIQEQIDINQVPDIGEPYGPMTVSIDAYGTDLNAANISWSLNGKKVQSGFGIKSLSFTLGARGQVSTVSININPLNGLPIQKTVRITPEDVDLLWQANSYTPPFYKGKALYPPQGTITFVAVPEFVVNGKSIDSHNLIYKWIKDTTVLGDQSGYGKSSITVSGSVIAKPTNMQVDVSTVDGNVLGRQLLTVSPDDTEALIYENNPLYGVLFNKAITDTFTLNTQEVQFEA